MAASGPNKKIANSLMAVSSAAIVAVYAAGYVRTRATADRFEAEIAGRRPSIPAPATHELTVPIAGAGLSPSPVPAPAESHGKTNEPVVALEAKAPAPARPAAGTTIGTTTGEAAASPVAPAEAASAPVVAQPEAPPVAVTAPGPPAAAQPEVSLSAPPWKDGSYDAWGECRHGDIQATVVIEGGKIKSAVISQCATRYSCDVIDKLPPQVVKRQSENVDSVSGATQSADAFYGAVYYALAKASAAAKN